MTQTNTEATFDDLEKVPPHLRGEIMHGVLYTSPRPALPHTLACTILTTILCNAFQRGVDGPGGWWIIQEPELRLSRNALVPDIAGWKKERLTPDLTTKAVEVVPDWICEILSPDRKNRKTDRQIKPAIYLKDGVSYLWIVDPIARELEVFRAQGGQWVLEGNYSDDDKIKAVPFDALEIDLSELWVKEPQTEEKSKEK